MKKHLLPTLAASWVLLGCQGASPKGETRADTRAGAEPAAAPRKASPAPSSSSYGEAIRPGPVLELSKVLDRPSDYAGKTLTVEGEVRRVCKKMGCWMELATGMSESDKGCRVFFGAHQFFVPKDSDGSRARVQGELQLKKVEASFVEHLEAEGGEFASKNPDGTADEVRLVATGVELWKS
jgi:hypothetical protein